ncbi:hypothetical protein ACFZAD_39855 [Streptomyces iakyrus]|uniref:hypothetical protein n=1 Tax=Streptomyces iakyrus TaxID=68219 RepID=UPI0036E71DE7
MDIARLNQGEPQADGRTFTDADEIYPGWQWPCPHTGFPAPDKPADDHNDGDPPAEQDDSTTEPSYTVPPEQPAAPDRDGAGSDTNRDTMPSTPVPEQAAPASADGYSETGDRAGLERTAHQLNRISVESGLDSSPETVALLNALLAANSVVGAAIA